MLCVCLQTFEAALFWKKNAVYNVCLLNSELSNVFINFSSVEKASLFCELFETILNKHAPQSLWKVRNYNSSHGLSQ